LLFADVVNLCCYVEEGGETIFPKGKFTHGDPGTPSYDHEAKAKVGLLP
jgi:hypothetical protein